MKKLILMSALVMGGLGINSASAQLGIRVNLHFGSGPTYVPAPPPPAQVVDDQPVYDDDDFYYLPEVEAYYSVNEHCYYYQDGNRWISAAFLPGRFHDFDWRYAKHYEVRAQRPYLHHDAYRNRFGGYVNRDDFYARAYPDRRGFDPNRGRDNHFDNRGFDNRGGFDRRDDRGFDNRGGFDRHDDRGQNNNYNRGGFDRNHGGNNQPQQNQGGYNQPQPSQNQGGFNQGGQGRNQGGYNQPSQNQGQQPSQGQGQQGGRGGNNQGQGQGNGQPANHSGNQNGNNTSGEHFAGNRMGVIQDRGEFARPVRN